MIADRCIDYPLDAAVRCGLPSLLRIIVLSRELAKPKGNLRNRIEHYRAERHPFVAGIQITVIATETHLAAHTEDLNLFGCFVETTTPFADGTKVRLRINHGGAIFAAQGRVAYERDRSGIMFTSIEPNSAAVLDAWLTELRK